MLNIVKFATVTNVFDTVEKEFILKTSDEFTASWKHIYNLRARIIF